jgi:outer membrane protein assembly factor BamB
MSDNWSQLYGAGRTFCGPSNSAIPVDEPQWSFSTKIGISGLFPVTFNHNIFLKDNDGFIFVLDKKTGLIKWTSQYYQENHTDNAYSIPFLDKNFFIVWPVIFDSHEGEVILDLQQHSEFSKALLSSGAFGKAGNFLYKQIDRSENKYNYAVYDLKSKQFSLLKLPYGEFIIFLSEKFGLAFDNSQIIYIELLTKTIIWSIDLAIDLNLFFDYHIYEKFIYINNEANLHKIDITTGTLVWSIDLTGYHEEIKLLNNVSTVSICTDMCVVQTPHFLLGLSSNTGEKKWESEKLYSTSGHCISGDLVFAHDSRQLVALDRYSGQEVWRVSDMKFAEASVKAIKGMLLVEGYGGHFICSYPWDENNPYRSTAKPKVTIEA